jgi:hypothetical protein
VVNQPVQRAAGFYAVSYIAHRVGDGDETYLRDDTESLEFLAYQMSP